MFLFLQIMYFVVMPIALGIALFLVIITKRDFKKYREYVNGCLKDAYKRINANEINIGQKKDKK